MNEPTHDNPMTALDEAIAACNNSVTVFAQRIGVGQSTVSMWKTRKRIGAEYVPAIFRETGVAPERLRPDIPWDVLRAQTGAWSGKERRKSAAQAKVG